MANAFGSALKSLDYLEHLHLGVFLSDDPLISSHVSHVMEEELSPYTLQNWGDCQRCFDGIAGEIRRRELEASLLVAQKLKSLRTIGWSSLLAADAGITRMEQHINSDDTIDDAVEQYQDHGEDDEDGFGGNDNSKPTCTAPDEMDDQDMKTTIWILRVRGRIRVRRAPW
ncbi:hypothetical protein C0991_004808 [Blastosporella zonata]|nr:hypothetical protein C0991_004808 [Blastosporella zonata]